MLKRLTRVLAVVFLAACGGVQEEGASVEAEALGAAEAALTRCGTTCPSGYYTVSYSCSYSCGNQCTFTGAFNQVTCQPYTTTFTQCGATCPTGWRAVSRSCSYNCGNSCDGVSMNQVTCTK